MSSAEPAADRARAAAPRRRLAAALRLELRLLLRNGENLLVTLGIPLGLLVFFLETEVLDVAGDLLGFLVPGVLVVAVMGSAMVSLGITTGFERSSLVLKRLGATPLRRGELVGAKLLAILAVQVIQVTLLLGVAAVGYGWPGPGGTPGAGQTALTLVAALVAGSAAFAGIGLALAGTLRATSTLAVVNALFVALVLVSGLVFPLDALPPPLATGAQVLPSAALAELLRWGTGAQQATWPLGSGIVLGAWALLAPTVAARLFRWE